MRTSDFEYDLPAAAIAQEPIKPRDASRLLVVDGMEDRRFSELAELLDPGDVLVVNRTRVRRARLFGVKEGSGGKVEILLLRPLSGGRWEALVRPSRRLRPGTRLRFGSIAAEVAEGPDEGRAILEVDAGEEGLDAALVEHGTVPLPPYFTGRLADDERYQTVFAERVGSAAAPTAGLHFTPAVLAALEQLGVAVATIDLEIGLDTFRPISTDTVAEHEIHTEWFEVPVSAAEVIEERRRAGGRVVAVGTTVVRALESASESGQVRATAGSTDLFITPGYSFRCVDVMITNFHIPGSTLIVLVAAFMGPQWREAYRTALERGYRFLSFGDAMMVERNP